MRTGSGMAKWLRFAACGLLLATFGLGCGSKTHPLVPHPNPTPNPLASMTLTSPAFQDNTPLDPRFTCAGARHTPPLQFNDVPHDAKSLALTLEDPDAPHGTFIHWIVYDIASSSTGFAEASHSGNEGRNSAGTLGFSAPCPPSGTHHYVFTLYALDEVTQLAPGASMELFQNTIANHVIESATLTGLVSK